MNRLVCKSTDAIDPGSLPPVRRAAGGPARVLFLHSTAVGFATTTANLEHYAGMRADFDAVHVRVVDPAWARWFCKQLPGGSGAWGLDYRYLRHMLSARWHLRSLVGPRRALPLDHFDVVHIMTQQRGTAVLDLRRVNPTGARFAINLDATLAGWESMRGMPRIAPRVDHWLEGRVLRAADMVACASEWCAGSAERDCGVDRSRVVIHKPCARVAPAPPGTPRGREGGRLNLLFVGGVWGDKGGARLLAWHQARWADRATLHVVSGSAPTDTSARNVVWHGRVPHARLVGELLPTADILVVPTRWDTFLIAAQEAQAAGVPVVTTKTGGVGEVVQDGVTGFLCAAGDDAAYIRGVESLMNDPALHERMGRAAQEHAARDLSADVWHNHLLDQLVALADSRGVSRLPAASDRGSPELGSRP